MPKAQRLQRRKLKPYRWTTRLHKAEVWIVKKVLLPVITSALCQYLITLLAHWLKW